MTRREDQLERWLDGTLTEDERAVFEDRLDESPALAAEVELQASIDAALRRRFVAPDLSALTSRVTAAAAATAPVVPPRRFLLLPFAVATAASVMLALLLVHPPSDGEGDAARIHQERVGVGRQWVAHYRTVVTPITSCNNHPLPPPMQSCVGLSRVTFRGTPGCRLVDERTLASSPETRVFRIAVPPTHIVLVFVTEARSPAPVLPGDSDLHLHRRELGDRVLYELSTLPAPRALDAFSVGLTTLSPVR